MGLDGIRERPPVASGHPPPAQDQGLRPAVGRGGRVVAGDGVYIVALAWQVYELSDSPTALSLVGLAWDALARPSSSSEASSPTGSSGAAS